MKVLAVIGICLAVAQALPNDFELEWTKFKEVHNKSYCDEEENWRIKIYFENKDKIAKHNAKFDNGEVSYKVNENQFTDMLESEVNAKMNGYAGGVWKKGIPYVPDRRLADATVDWRNKGVVTPVKNQGKCGSCWAFSTTGSLEGQHYLKTGKLVSLSEQNLVDCSGKYGNQGCNGGLMNQAFEYIKDNSGIDTEESYPYTATNGSCYFTSNNVGATVTGLVDIAQSDENALKDAVSKIGPISIAIDASNWSFQQYCSGIYDEPKCSRTRLNHAVLVVGYGTENGIDYWLVKNSWGTQWGDQGYIKMKRNCRNQCGVATMALYPTV